MIVILLDAHFHISKRGERYAIDYILHILFVVGAYHIRLSSAGKEALVISTILKFSLNIQNLQIDITLRYRACPDGHVIYSVATDC